MGLPGRPASEAWRKLDSPRRAAPTKRGIRAESLAARFEQLARTTAANLAEMGEILRLFHDDQLWKELGYSSWSKFVIEHIKTDTANAQRMIEASRVFGPLLVERGYVKPSDTRIKFMAVHLEDASKAEKRKALKDAAEMSNAEFRSEYHRRPPAPRLPASGVDGSEGKPVRRGPGARPVGKKQTSNTAISYYGTEAEAAVIKAALVVAGENRPTGRNAPRKATLLAEICQAFLDGQDSSAGGGGQS